MAKIQSEKERKLQKKLIPLNIFVSILCLVSIFTLMFTPILKVDVGKIIRSDSMASVVNAKVDDMVEQNIGNSEATGAINFAPVVATIVSSVLNSAEGSVNFSAYDASKVANSSFDTLNALIKGEDIANDGNNAETTNAVMDSLFFGKNALVTRLIDSVVDGIGDLLKPTNENGASTLLYDTIEQAMVSTITTQLVQNLDSENISQEQAEKLTESFINNIESVQDGDVTQAVENFTTEMKSITGTEVSEEDKQAITEEVQKIYNETAEQLGEGQSVTLETIVCVTVSKNVPLDEFNLDAIFGSLLGGGDDGEKQPSGSLTAYKPATDEADGEQTPANPDEGEGSPSETPDGGEGNPSETPDEGEGNSPENPDESEGNPSDNPDVENPSEKPDGDKEQKIVTSYADLMTEIGFDDAKLDEIKSELRTSLRAQVDVFTQDVSGYMGLYGLLFYLMLLFTVPWIILFLFSFIRIFTKNKRFTMWYVKIFSFIPGLIALAVILLPKLVSVIPALSEMISGMLGSSLEGILTAAEMDSLVTTVLSSISSFMWISGICYILLWLASICWAFPIKRKIRKERKMVAKYGAYYEADTSASTSSDLYGNDYDDDLDGFNSPYEGSDYGYGSLFDDDDDDLF